MSTPTKKQKNILDFINSYINKHSVSPTIEEVARHFKRAVGTIHEHIEELVNKGFIKKNNSVRGIEIVKNNELISLPFKGFIAAGVPIEVVEEHETIDVPKNLLAKSGEHFVLRVKGDSMINDGVLDRDSIIVREQNIAENGDMVVALLNNEEATLKRFFVEKNRVRLQPANPAFRPIFTKNVIIQGKVVSVIRSFNNTEDETSDFTEHTTSYINQADIKYRKSLGQYFTPKPVREALIEQLLKNIKKPKILDPGCGTGEFLLTAKKYFPDAELFGWDIDKNLIGISQKNAPEAKLKCTDSLENEQYGAFDLVIGNPPYFEFTPSEKIGNKFQTIIGGRTNIFSLFIYQGLKWLKEGGYLAYVIPPSMNNGAYFAKLRNFIVENANIEYLHVLNDPKLFHGAQQTTMLLILKKGKNNGDYIFRKNGVVIFSEEVKFLEEAFKNRATLFDLGYEVKTGRVIWNEHKNSLTNDSKKGVPLIWSQNIGSNSLNLSANDKKPQYITKENPDIGPAIVVNRITGTVKSAKLKAAIVPPGMKFFAENHVNVITQIKDKKQGQLGFLNKSIKKLSISLNEIVKQLSSPDKLKVVRNITGNTQISKTELEKLFPIDISVLNMVN
ncbi:MAG: transcriptional repressor LexA [Patescibacteria group bacterium]|nr:transcriptional repressor LexA [Patescibacteria group bacterium]